MRNRSWFKPRRKPSEERDLIAYDRPTSQIWSLLVKNFKIRKHRSCQTVSQVFVVIFFCFVFIQGLYIFTDLTERKRSYYKEFSPVELDKMPSSIARYYSNMTLIFSPGNNYLINQVFQSMSNATGGSIIGFKSSEEMENHFQLDASGNILAGIDFGDSLAGEANIPDDVIVKIRFPSELRYTLNEEKYWSTHVLYSSRLQRREPRNFRENEGAIPSYFQEGFLTLQQLITYHIIIVKNNMDTDNRKQLPKIVMERFPHAALTFINVFEYNTCACALGVALAFTIACRFIIDTIVSEKESRIREGMKIMGFNESVNFLAMVIWSFSELLFPATLVIISLLVIPVNSGRTVCNFSDSSLVTFLILLCMLMLISYCLFLSAIFTREKVACVISSLVYFLGVALFMVTYKSDNFVYIIITNFLPPIAICYTIKEVITFENLGEGARWSTLWIPSSRNCSYSIGISIILSIVNIILFASLSPYLEAVLSREQDTYEHWYTAFVPTFWRRTLKVEDSEASYEGDTELAKVIEVPHNDLKVSVKVKNLYKIQNGRYVVKNVSFNLYESNVTVILGHYGAGKSEIASMITGITPMSSGLVTIYGYDIKKEPEKCRPYLGISLNFSMLFEYLTVIEHITFYCRLKGCSYKNLKREVSYYLDVCELKEKKNFLPPDMTLTLKRKLSIAIAFCGNSRIIILDEPTTGVDLESKNSIWDLLKELKQDRTILLTTYSSDEAENIADQIIVLARGEMKCSGTKGFLKTYYGIGYRLVIHKDEGCKSEEITDILSRFVNNVKTMSDTSDRIIYILPKYEFEQIKPMLEYVENNKQKLKLSSYSFTLTTLEDIFLKSDNTGNISSVSDNMTMTTTTGDIFNRYERQGFPKIKIRKCGVKVLMGIRLTINQIRAIQMKRTILIRRYWFLYILAFLMPTILILFSFLTRRKAFGSNLPAIEFHIEEYLKTTVLIQTNTISNIYEPAYRSLVTSFHADIQTVENLNEFYVPLTEDGLHRDHLYLLAATFELENETVPIIKLWFNNWPLHTPGLALQLALQVIYKVQLGNRHNIHFVNHPFGFKLESRQYHSLNEYDTKSTGVLDIGIIICMLSIFYIHERVSKSKYLQLASGIKVTVFWFISCLADFICSFFVMLAATITIVVIRRSYTNDSPMDVITIFLVLMLYCCTYLPIIYVTSIMSTKVGIGYFALIFLLCMTFIGIVPLISVISYRHPKLTRFLESLSMLIFHPYAAYKAVQKVYAASDLSTNCVNMINICEDSGMERSLCKEQMCQRVDICCETDINYFNLEEYGLAWQLLSMVVHGISWWMILFLLEFRCLSPYLRPLFGRKIDEFEIHDKDVMQENKSVIGMSKQELRKHHAIALKNVSKSTCCFRPCLSLNRIFLAIERKELFCLLGVKGAGKTTLFRILTGDLNLTYGKAWILGYSVRSKMSHIRKHIGFCPQYEAYPDFMTVKEILIMYCLIKGVPSKECISMAEEISDEFGLNQYLKMRSKKLSGSIRRKLSVAIAMIKDPEVLLLDEPTAGLDSKTKLEIWQRIRAAHARGMCVFLATNDIEECEVLSSRAAMIVRGKLTCIGSIPQLREKFSLQDILIVKGYTGADYERISLYFARNFEKTRLVDSDQTVLTFTIEDTRPLATKLVILEKAKNKLLIQDYSLSQSSLEHVFLTLMRKQNPTMRELL